MLLRLIGERGMGQNDPHRTDDLSVTKMKVLRLIEARGGGTINHYHTGRLSVTRYITRVDIVSAWILPCKCGCRALHKSITDASNEA